MQATDSQLFQMAFFKWLDISGVVFFVGSIAFRQLVLLPSLQSIHDQTIRIRILEEDKTKSTRFLWFLLFYLSIFHFLSLIHKARMMDEGYVALIWCMKLLLLFILIILVRRRKKWSGYILFGFASLLCLMGSLGGHAVEQAHHFIVLTDWLHFTAVSVWVGGLLPLMKTVRQGRRWLAGSDLTIYLSKTLEVFSIWAILCVVTIIATGGFNAMIYLGAQEAIFAPLYGKVLALKLSFVLIAFSIGGFSGFYILPRIQKSQQNTSYRLEALERLFYRAVTIEIAIAMTVLILAAFLTQTTLPHPGG